MSNEMNTEPIIISVVATEKAYRLAEKQNYLIFKVRRDATKNEIKRSVEQMYNVKVVKVNTAIDRDGYKKAYVRLAPEYNALDILERLTR